MALAALAYSSPLGILILSLVGFALIYVVNRIFFYIPYPPDVAFIREPEGKKGFSLRTRLAYHVDCERLLHDAYHNYSKKEKVVVIPGFFTGYEVVLPPSSMKWMLAQPEHIIDTSSAFKEVDQAYYSLGDDRPAVDSWQGTLIKTQMNAVLHNLMPPMNEELGVAFDKYFGTDTAEWREVDLHAAVRLIIAQAASRFTVGLPLCRNEEWLKDNIKMTDGMILNAGLTRGTPPIFRSLVGPLAGWSSRRCVAKVAKHWKSLYKERLAFVQKHPIDDPDVDEPCDFVQMMMRFAQKERPAELVDFKLMTARLCMANFASMHQTAIQVTNMLLSIIGSDAEHGTIASLRDELARTAFSEDNSGDGLWTRASIAQMVRADSVARETIRLYTFGGRTLFRRIAAPGGVTTDKGTHLPQGTILTFFSQPAHMDAETYEEPLKFDPFRFSRLREAASADTGKGGPPMNFVSTSLDHLPFGHGKHACPGRFLLDFELKMIIAHVLRKYDVKFPEEYGGKRPDNQWLSEAYFPPSGAKILVRRRESEDL